MNATWKGAVLGAVGLLLLIIAIVLLVILTGSYNVAATQRHGPIAAWALDTAFINSVKSRGDELEPPARFTRQMIAAGASEYNAMCAHCHGGVGQKRAEWSEGMRPKPPALAHAAERWTHAEVFWLVKHGAKMTGMPAFGPTHDDAALWNIAAFVKAMPKMPAAEYAGYSAKHGDGVDEGHSHAAGSGHHMD
jgi:mono/diheme cytochrome c family protein